MAGKFQNPTHFRLQSALKKIGPYLREGECNEQHYFFDCLAVCVDEKKSPELREFYGWWMELSRLSEDKCEAKFYLGIYNKAGEWEASPVDKAHQSEIEKTQQDFLSKLTTALEPHGIEYTTTQELSEFA